MSLAQIIAIRRKLNQLQRLRLQLTATRPVPHWPANLGRLD